jgi:hypothetical protein
LEEFRNYEKKIKDQAKKGKTEEEPFITNRHPKVKKYIYTTKIKTKVKLSISIKDSEFPPETGLNPFLNKLKDDAHNITNLRLSQTIQAHNLPISS